MAFSSTFFPYFDPQDQVFQVRDAPVIRDDDRYDALGTKYVPFRTTADDGLVLAGREYGIGDYYRPAVLCIPGHNRNSRDFEPLAKHFTRVESGYRVVLVDLRGRGESGYDPAPGNYNPITESKDVMTIIERLSLHKPIVIGTSRGGIVAMTIASLRPNPFSGVVLNDIGPVVGLRGILKLKRVYGTIPTLRTWEEAARWVGFATRQEFPYLDRQAHERIAHRVFRDRGNRIVVDHDPNIRNELKYVTPLTILPQMWTQFAALTGCPVLALRGKHSSVLSETTLTTMRSLHPRMSSYTVPNEGHAPLLEDRVTLERIGLFLKSC